MLRIAISGKSGCGNTTVSSLLAQRLGVNIINYTFRQLAQEAGLTLDEVITRAKTDTSYDKSVDSRQLEAAREGSCVLGSRLAVWLLKEADLTVYLYADLKTRVSRIHEREGGKYESVKAFTEARDTEDSRRYASLYGIDNNDYSQCDMIINTGRLTPQEIVEAIINRLSVQNLLDKL